MRLATRRKALKLRSKPPKVVSLPRSGAALATMALCDSTNNNGNFFSHCLADCLTDLRLHELLLLKKSLAQLSVGPADVYENETVQQHGAFAEFDCVDQHCAQPQRMALMGAATAPAAASIKDRSADHRHQPPHHHHHGQPSAAWQSQPATAVDEKPSKLQTLFQISITALSFLSFGGYLLCLIVQAIKSKGTTYFHPVATATTATANGGGVRRIKIYRRGRRTVARQKRHPRPNRTFLAAYA